MVGGEFTAVTSMVNAARLSVSSPSVTVMTIFPYCPASALPGVPLNLPVVVLNEAQAGLFEMLNEIVSLSGSLAVGVNV